MATGSSKYSDISTLVANIYDGALYTLENQTRLLPTVRLYTNNRGLAPRSISEYTATNVRTVVEGDDVTPTQLGKTLLGTITPSIKADQYFITDARMESDPDDVMRDASIQLGNGFADKWDSDIVGVFSSFTGGTVGSAGNALTWTMISNAQAILSANKAYGQVFCVLHPYQWADLVATATTAGHSINSIVNVYNDLSAVYFQSAGVAGVTFAVTPAISIDSNDDAIGAMYVMDAIGVDIRKPFYIETQRDASRGGTEVNAQMHYGVGVIRPTLGVKIVSDATTPS
jgi:hypothetical protein